MSETFPILVKDIKLQALFSELQKNKISLKSQDTPWSNDYKQQCKGQEKLKHTVVMFSHYAWCDIQVSVSPNYDILALF